MEESPHSKSGSGAAMPQSPNIANLAGGHKPSSQLGTARALSSLQMYNQMLKGLMSW
jgi:hypothetical protein